MEDDASEMAAGAPMPAGVPGRDLQQVPMPPLPFGHRVCRECGGLQQIPAEDLSHHPLEEHVRCILYMRHVASCTQPAGACSLRDSCTRGKALWEHIITCAPVRQFERCDMPGCLVMRRKLHHHRMCQDPHCHLCNTVQLQFDRYLRPAGRQGQAAQNHLTPLQAPPTPSLHDRPAAGPTVSVSHCTHATRATRARSCAAHATAAGAYPAGHAAYCMRDSVAPQAYDPMDEEDDEVDPGEVQSHESLPPATCHELLAPPRGSRPPPSLEHPRPQQRYQPRPSGAASPAAAAEEGWAEEPAYASGGTYQRGGASSREGLGALPSWADREAYGERAAPPHAAEQHAGGGAYARASSRPRDEPAPRSLAAYREAYAPEHAELGEHGAPYSAPAAFAHTAEEVGRAGGGPYARTSSRPRDWDALPSRGLPDEHLDYLGYLDNPAQLPSRAAVAAAAGYGAHQEEGAAHAADGTHQRGPIRRRGSALHVSQSYREVYGDHPAPYSAPYSAAAAAVGGRAQGGPYERAPIRRRGGSMLHTYREESDYEQRRWVLPTSHQQRPVPRPASAAAAGAADEAEAYGGASPYERAPFRWRDPRTQSARGFAEGPAAALPEAAAAAAPAAAAAGGRYGLAARGGAYQREHTRSHVGGLLSRCDDLESGYQRAAGPVSAPAAMLAPHHPAGSVAGGAAVRVAGAAQCLPSLQLPRYSLPAAADSIDAREGYPQQQERPQQERPHQQPPRLQEGPPPPQGRQQAEWRSQQATQLQQRPYGYGEGQERAAYGAYAQREHDSGSSHGRHVFEQGGYDEHAYRDGYEH